MRKRNRLGFTLAEVLVMVIIAGSCMVPIIGVMFDGIERTEKAGHRERMRAICQNAITASIASGTYLHQPVDEIASDVLWPEADGSMASYPLEVKVVDRFQIGTLSNSINGDFAAPCNVNGTQPSYLKAVLVTVSHYDPGSDATDTVKQFSLVAVPRSQTIDRIYCADPNAVAINVLDPETRNLIDVIKFPLDNPALNNAANHDLRPGNIDVHPSGKWVGIQMQYDVKMLNVDEFSADYGKLTVVFTSANPFLEKPENTENTRKDRGLAFRPDGRYCYVTNHTEKKLYVLEVPSVLPGSSWTAVKTFTLVSDKYIDIHVGNDGFLYLTEEDNANQKVLRMNMYTHDTPAVFDFTPSQDPRAACTTRDGRDVLILWKAERLGQASSTNPASQILTDMSDDLPTGGDDLRDLQVAADGKSVVMSSKKNATKNQIYSAFLPLNKAAIEGGFVAPNSFAEPEATDIFNQVICSPFMKDILVDRQGAGEMYFLDTASISADIYKTSVPAPRTISFAETDTSCVGTRLPEFVLVGCSNGSKHTLEWVDIYSQSRYIERAKNLSDSPSGIAINKHGDKAIVIPELANKNPQAFDVFAGKAIEQPTFSPAADRTMKKVCFDFSGGYYFGMLSSSNSTDNDVWIVNLDETHSSLAHPTDMAILDMIPLNDGGAFVLHRKTDNSFTRLTWIGADRTVWGTWDSRHDNFPINGVTKMAVSADDSLLAMYNPTGDATDKDFLYIYDLRSQNFGKLTHQKGLISLQNPYDSATKEFNQQTGYHFDGNAVSIKLKDAFTRNSTFQDMDDYPGNFKLDGATDNLQYAPMMTRFFGYLYPSKAVRKIAAGLADGSRFYVDGIYSPPGTWGAGSWRNQEWDINDIDPIRGVTFQLDHLAEDTNSGSSIFTTDNSGTALPGTEAGVTGTGYTSASLSGWDICGADQFRPLRFHPQLLHTFRTGVSTTGEKWFLVFSRDIASPTLYAFNKKNADLGCVPFGGNVVKKDLSADIKSDSVTGMVISPDNNRLVIVGATPAGQNAVFFVDISVPIGSTYGTVVGSASLPFAPVCVASRPFCRQKNAPNSYQVLPDSFSVAPPLGCNLAAVASGGIYALGGMKFDQSTPQDSVFLFDPVKNGLGKITGVVLPKAVKNPAVISYDDELLVMNGKDSTAVTPWVQKFNPTTRNVLSSVDPTTSSVFTPGLPTGLTNHWPFDEGSGTTANDVIGDKDGTLNNVTWEPSGKHGSAVYCTGSSDSKVHMSDDSLLDLTSPFSVALWARPAQLPNDWEAILSKLDGTTYGFSIWTNNGNGTDGDLEIWINSGGPDVSVTDFFSINTWVHIAVTFSGGTMKIYKNGTLEKTQTGVSTPTDNGAGPAFGGRSKTDSSYLFQGNIDDVQYYNKVLSAAEVIVARDGGTTVTVDDPVPAGKYMTKTTGDDPAVAKERQNQGGCLTPYGPIISGGEDNSAVCQTNTRVYWPHVFKEFDPRELEPDFNFPPGPPIVAYYKLDETSGTNAKDSSLSGYDGELKNFTGTFWGTGKIGNGLSFDGSDDFVLIGDKPDLNFGTGNFTLMCWAKLNNNTSLQTMISKTQDTPTELGYVLRYDNDIPGTGKSLQCVLTDNDNYRVEAGTLDTTGFHHLAAVRDGDNLYVYKDGALAGSDTGASGVDVSSSLNFALGRRYGSSGNYLNGILDEVVVFNKALSLAEVNEWFTGTAKPGPLLARYKLNDGSGGNAADSSGNGITGSLTGCTWTDGKFGKCLSFNGTSDFVNLGNPAALNPVHLSLSAWIKTSSTGSEDQICSKDSPAASPRVWQFRKNASEKLEFIVINQSVVAGTVIGATTISDGKWHHVAGTWDGTTIKVYVDGVLDGSAAFSGTLQSGQTNNAYIGKSDNLDNGFWNGLIDDVHIYNRALTLAEVEELSLSGPRKVSAKMTSAALPAPNKVNASTEDTGDSEYGWKAFDGSAAGSQWEAQNSSGDTLDYRFGLGNPKVVNKIRIDAYGDDADESLKEFEILGSNDAFVTSTSLFSGSLPKDSTTVWHEFAFNNQTAYLYYRLKVISNWGDSDTVVDELEYWFDPYVYYLGISRDLPSMAANRVNHSLVWHKGKLYRVGGSTDGTTLLDTVDRFDFDTNSWGTPLTAASDADEFTDSSNLFKRQCAAACSFGDEIFIFGGIGGSGVLNTAAAWNPTTGVVRAIKNLPSTNISNGTTDATGVAGKWLNAVPCGPHIYLIGGGTTTTYSGMQILKYTP